MEILNKIKIKILVLLGLYKKSGIIYKNGNCYKTFRKTERFKKLLK